MTKTNLMAASDVMVSSGYPTQNYGSKDSLQINGSPRTRRSFLFFNQPFPIGVQVLSATLRVYQKGAATGGNRTLSVQRAETGWKESTVTWKTAPESTGTPVDRPLGNSSTDGREWTFDVKAHMQAVANGSAWHGFRISSDNETMIGLYSRVGKTAFRPRLEVEWVERPRTPVHLSPSAGRSVSVARPTLRCDYQNPEDDLDGVNFQVSTSPTFASIAFNSGELAVALPEWQLSGDLAIGTTYYWRARVKDAAGYWSAWSETAVFKRTAKPTVSITSPSSSSPVVHESMPTFSWAVSGNAQQAYQLFIVDAENLTKVLWTSGKLASTESEQRLPAAQQLLLQPSGSYRLVLRLWDAVARETIPEESPYVEVARNFSFETSSSTPGVTDLSLKTDPESPFVTLEFKRDAAPEAFLIIEAGTAIDLVDPDDIHVSGTTYRYVDRSVGPRHTRTWGVAARVGNSTSNFATVTGRSEPAGVWLYDLDGPNAICIWGAGEPDGMVSSAASEETSIFKPAGSPNPVLISQAIRGPEGEVKGEISRSDLAAWNNLTARRAVTLGLTRVDLAQKVQIYDTWRDQANEFDTNTIPIKFSFVVIR